jgi:hypothetical protein
MVWDWKIINGPQDLPSDYQVVLVSDGNISGVAFHRNRTEMLEWFRADGWVMIHPIDPDQKFKIIKWTELP